MIIENEIWVDIQGYEGLYQISDIGRVKSLNRIVPRKRNKSGETSIKEKILKPIRTGQYHHISLSKNGILSPTLIHRLVGMHHIPNPENKPYVNHIAKNEDGTINTYDNRVMSLEWATAKENSRHAWDNGLCENIREATKRTAPERNSRKVKNLDTDEVYSSVKEAANNFLIKPRTLSSMLNGNIPNKTPLVFCNAPKAKLKTGKLILNLDNGIFYESVREVCSIYPIKRSTLTSRLNGQVKNNKGSFIYA